jgi:hypothetical protein
MRQRRRRILVAFTTVSSLGDQLFPERVAPRRALVKWAENNARRDELVRDAVAAGVAWREIQEITGLARSTISRIVAKTSAA